jgi:hypothetical protein
MVTTAGLADSATATTASDEVTVTDRLAADVALDDAAPVDGTAVGAPMVPVLTSAPTVAAEAMVAERSETARTPARRRSRTGREEVAGDAGTTGSPALFAVVAAWEEAAGSDAWEEATGVNGSKMGGSSVPLVPLVLFMRPFRTRGLRRC